MGKLKLLIFRRQIIPYEQDWQLMNSPFGLWEKPELAFGSARRMLPSTQSTSWPLHGDKAILEEGCQQQEILKYKGNQLDFSP